MNRFFQGLLLSLLVWPPAQLSAAEGTRHEPTSEMTTVALAEPAILKVENHTIVEFRAPFLGIPPEKRRQRAERAISEALTDGNALVTHSDAPQGISIHLNGELVFFVTQGDADVLAGKDLSTTAADAVANLQQVIKQTSETRNWQFRLKALGLIAVASVLLWLALMLLRKGRDRLFDALARFAERHAENLKVAGTELVATDRLRAGFRLVLKLLFGVMFLVLGYEWLAFCLAQFPYTAPWADDLHLYMLGMLGVFATAIVSLVPDLVTAVAIFYLAKKTNDGIRLLLRRVETGVIKLAWLEADAVKPTRQIISVVVWLLALAMAYPYLPGSSSAAFQGLSVLVGLMLSFGGSGLVGQAASGLTLMYTKTLKVGEYVRIGDMEGTVVSVGTFTTRLRTGLGEELCMPNTVVLSTTTTNYSRTVQGPGFVLDTHVTIGYDTPWRQVQAMLELAAKQTTGVLAEPAPKVFQTELSDFYIHYRLVCQAIPADPRPRAEVLNQLHANILDVFNQFGVQIMSPGYYEDPAIPKVVPIEHWHDAPAVKPADTSADLKQTQPV